MKYPHALAPKNYVRDVLALAFPSESKRRVAVMLAAYFDESGTHKGSNWVAVAGYVADASAWVRYDEKWKSELTAYQLPFFHMKEFARNQKGYRWGTSKRRNRFAKLQGITRRT